MEQMRQVALAYYENFSSEDKEKIKKLFQEMDVNGDGKISFGEYKWFLAENGHHNGVNSNGFFMWLDLDESGSLDFEEIITLYYMVNKFLVRCDVCRAYQMGSYFSCVQCFLSDCNTYDLCCNCYGEKKYKHHSDAIFLDNKTLLYESRNLVRKELGKKEVMDSDATKTETLEVRGRAGSSKAADGAVTALKLGLKVAEIAETSASIVDHSATIADTASNIADIAGTVASIAACSIQ